VAYPETNLLIVFPPNHPIINIIASHPPKKEASFRESFRRMGCILLPHDIETANASIAMLSAKKTLSIEDIKLFLHILELFYYMDA